jgi:hypothetical protein
MMSRRSDQKSLFQADVQYLEFVGQDSFYGFLARHGRELFGDEDFAELYCPDNGRPSVPPGLLATALLLQAHDRVSDWEATQRAAFDMRWKVALGIEMDERPFAKSTLQLFRAQLVIHDKAQQVFRRSLEWARQTGYLKGRKMRAAVDTTVILGRGAMEDTYNLISHGIKQLCRVLAQVEGEEPEQWAKERGLGRHFSPSIKGSCEVDWDDEASREAFLTSIIEDGKVALELARQVRSGLEEGSEEDQRIAKAAELLSQLLWQDVEPTERGYRIRQGTAKDRIPSVHDPEQRHGHKSHGKSFTGYKGAVAVDTETQLVTAVDVVAGNEPEGDGAAKLVEDSEENTASELEQVIGDTAYGSMQTRKSLGDREVIAPTVKSHRATGITKEDFEINMAEGWVRCPMGHRTTHWTWARVRAGRGEPKVKVKRYAFPKDLCRACPRYGECVTDRRRRGRFVTLHPDEELLQAARALERTEYFRQRYQQRVVVEHRIARLVQLGIRQSRYFGRRKTLFQLLMAATVANLTLIAGHMAGKPMLDPAMADGGELLPFLVPTVLLLWAAGVVLMACGAILGKPEPIPAPAH